MSLFNQMNAANLKSSGRQWPSPSLGRFRSPGSIQTHWLGDFCPWSSTSGWDLRRPPTGHGAVETKNPTHLSGRNTAAAVVAPALSPTLFQGSDILWFFDNEAAVSALLRVATASTAEPDVLILVHQAHLQFHELQWIDSASNPSDGLF